MVTNAYQVLSPNLGLLDARATGRTFAELRTNFLPVDFFDLCSTIVEMILREKIVLVGKYDLLPRPYRDALSPFVREGIFDLCLRPVTLTRLKGVAPELRGAAQDLKKSGFTSSTVFDADCEVARLLAAEVDLRVPTIPLLRHLHNYGFTRRPYVDNTICDLSTNLRDIETMAEEVLRQEARRTRIRHVSVPPIALEVLQRAKSTDQISTAILEKRHEYRKLRQKMREITEILSDQSLTTDEYIRIESRWRDQWQTVAHNSVSGTMGLGRSSGALLAHGIEIASALEEEHYIGAALSVARLYKDTRNLLQQRLFRPVHYSVRNYIQSGHLGMVKTVGRLFEMDVRFAHQQLALVASINTSVWRRALEGQKSREMAPPRANAARSPESFRGLSLNEAAAPPKSSPR